jgi:hypothetical protein
MKFRNPWIDPRVADLRPETLQAYLTRHGWKEIGPAENARLMRYETSDANAPTLFVPLQTGDGAAVQWMIELIGSLATWEGRFTGDLLSDLLGNDGANGSNGEAARRPVSGTVDA